MYSEYWARIEVFMVVIVNYHFNQYLNSHSPRDLYIGHRLPVDSTALNISVISVEMCPIRNVLWQTYRIWKANWLPGFVVHTKRPWTIQSLRDLGMALSVWARCLTKRYNYNQRSEVGGH